MPHIIILDAEYLEREKHIQEAREEIKQIQRDLRDNPYLTLDECADVAKAIRLYQTIIDGVFPDDDEDEDL